MVGTDSEIINKITGLWCQPAFRRTSAPTPTPTVRLFSRLASPRLVSYALETLGVMTSVSVRDCRGGSVRPPPGRGPTTPFSSPTTHSGPVSFSTPRHKKEGPEGIDLTRKDRPSGRGGTSTSGSLCMCCYLVLSIETPSFGVRSPEKVVRSATLESCLERVGRPGVKGGNGYPHYDRQDEGSVATTTPTAPCTLL